VGPKLRLGATMSNSKGWPGAAVVVVDLRRGRRIPCRDFRHAISRVQMIRWLNLLLRLGDAVEGTVLDLVR
jgi:hypothetical protein